MIENNVQLEIVRNQVASLEHAIIKLRGEVENERNFAVFSEPYADQIRELRAAIDAYIGLAPAADISIRLQGDRVELGTLSAGTVSRYIDALRRGVQAVVGLVDTSSSKSSTGRNPRWVEQLCDFPIVGVAGGSVSVLLDEPTPDPTLFDEEQRQVLENAFELLFGGLQWTTSTTSTVDGLPADDDGRTAILSVIANLLPPASGDVEAVEIGRQSGKQNVRVTLTRDSRRRIRDEMKRLSSSTTYAEVSGELRRVDLDKREFVLTGILEDTKTQLNVSDELRCEYGTESEGAVKQALDQLVCVSGPLTTQPRSKKQTLSVDTIEVLTGPTIDID